MPDTTSGIFFCKEDAVGTANASRKEEIAHQVLEILRRPENATKGGLEKAVTMLRDSACFEEELNRFHEYVKGLPGAKVESKGDR